MNQFYVSIIFLGVTLIAISLVWIAFDMKRSNDYEKRIDEKKKDLVEIISDSEQMIEELNKFSDYIVTQMDIKNEEMNGSLKLVEEKIKQFEQKISENCEVVYKRDRVVNGRPIEIRSKSEMTAYSSNNDLVVEALGREVPAAAAVNAYRQNSRVKDNVIPLNSRHKEVLRLYENGLSDTEIAKTLNMGKGEIQLILGVNR